MRGDVVHLDTVYHVDLFDSVLLLLLSLTLSSVGQGLNGKQRLLLVLSRAVERVFLAIVSLRHLSQAWSYERLLLVTEFSP